MKTNRELLETNDRFFVYLPEKIGIPELRKISRYLIKRCRIKEPAYKFSINEIQTKTFKKNMLTRLYYQLNIDKEKGCWHRDDWSVYRQFDGQPAHRISYELFCGPRKSGMYICHHCDRPGCINPYHLFEGTHIDNMNDAVIKGNMPMPTNPTRLMQVITILQKNIDNYK